VNEINYLCELQGAGLFFLLLLLLLLLRLFIPRLLGLAGIVSTCFTGIIMSTYFISGLILIVVVVVPIFRRRVR